MDATDREFPVRYHEHSVVWLYNEERIHAALDYLTPAAVYAAA